MRCDVRVSLLPAHEGQSFLFPVLVVTCSLFLSEGRETGKNIKSCPSLVHDSLGLFAIFHPQEKQTSIFPPILLGNPFPFAPSEIAFTILGQSLKLKDMLAMFSLPSFLVC